jgi:SAM-dependent methyltransferase
MPAYATEEEILAGTAVLTPLLLRFYNLIFWTLNGHLVWRCTFPPLVAHAQRYVSSRHLDVGVGNGSLLDACRFPTSEPQITLLDLNPPSLTSAARRLARYHPRVVHTDCLDPFPLPPASFDSIGAMHMIHCLPGTMSEKAVVFDNCREVLAPGGVMYGCIILNGGVEHTAVSRAFLRIYNWRKYMTNLTDGVDDLNMALKQRFTHHTVEVVGSVALFAAWN